MIIRSIRIIDYEGHSRDEIDAYRSVWGKLIFEVPHYLMRIDVAAWQITGVRGGGVKE
ncbi:MAG: hypothetical protein [Siphoviridae sp. ctCJE6]|nr:MAG: hypothetical protein [Siphoviridae sp. ctCJE6]